MIFFLCEFDRYVNRLMRQLWDRQILQNIMRHPNLKAPVHFSEIPCILLSIYFQMFHPFPCFGLISQLYRKGGEGFKPVTNISVNRRTFKNLNVSLISEPDTLFSSRKLKTQWKKKQKTQLVKQNTNQCFFTGIIVKYKPKTAK